MDAAVVGRAVGDAAAVLESPVLAALRTAPDLTVRPHGTVVGFALHGDRRRRVIEIDRSGTLLAAIRWNGTALAEATLRIPDGRFVTIEPGVRVDRVWLGERPGREGAEPIVEYAALDYATPGEIPALPDPARLPSGAGTTVLNAIAVLAADAGVRSLAYRGPYPTEQLFLSLLESFRYAPRADDPLAEFAGGTLAWTPAPHERCYEREGVVVQLRERVEKVVWERRTYYRPDWQTIARHAPRRVRDADDGVACGLWILGAPVEDHLELTRDGTLVRVVAPAPTSAPPRALPADVVHAVVATVAATAIPALAPFVREAGRELSAEWGAVARDVVAIHDAAVRISARVRSAAVTRLVDVTDRARRVALGFALIGELAGMIGDVLRARAQVLLAARPADEQAAALEVAEDPERAAAAAVIGRGIEALLSDLSG